MNSNSSQNASLHNNIKQPISYSFSYSNANTGVNANSQTSYTTKKIECDKHFNIYKGNTDDTMVYYCPSSKYDYMMRNQTSSYPKEYSTKILTIIMDELNVHPISLKDISWTHPRFNPYANFIHDEMHLQKYGINDINGWLKESVVQLDGQVKRYNYQITLKPNNTIKTLELDNAGTTKSQFYFIGEKDNNNIQAINKLQTEQMHKLVNFHDKETKIGNVEIILAIALILLLLITIIGSIIDKIQEKKQKERKAEEKKSYAIKKIK